MFQCHLILSYHSTAKEKVFWQHHPICHRNISFTTVWRASIERHETVSKIISSSFSLIWCTIASNSLTARNRNLYHISTLRTGFCPKQNQEIPWLYKEVESWKTSFCCFLLLLFYYYYCFGKFFWARNKNLNIFSVIRSVNFGNSFLLLQ